MCAKKNNESIKERIISKCQFCGCSHAAIRGKCPASMAECYRCHRLGHFKKYCKTRLVQEDSDSKQVLSSVVMAGAPGCLKDTTIIIRVDNQQYHALIDSGAANSHIKSSIATSLGLSPRGLKSTITLASNKCSTEVSGYVEVGFQASQNEYRLRFGVIEDLCSDFVLGIDFMRLHKEVSFRFEGSMDTFSVNPGTISLAIFKVDIPPRIFQFLSVDCKPIAAPPRRFSKEDNDFIRSEVQRLVKEGIVEPSHSPWRAQPLVTKPKDTRHKRRLVIDYSQTINKFTNLDVYPLPKISEVVNEIAKGKYFSAVDLKSAYHQVLLHPADRPFTAFAANGSLHRRRRQVCGVCARIPKIHKYTEVGQKISISRAI